jgi:TatD DNase family protein
MTMSAILTDTHCHLVSDRIYGQAEELIGAAKGVGVERIVNVAYNLETAERGLALAERFEGVWTTIGIQPHDASSYSPDLAEKMRKQAKACSRVVAVGEVGLDAYYTLSPMKVQKECFDHFLSIATEDGQPVVVHVRETHRDTVEMLSRYVNNGLTGVIHCFTGTLDEALEFVDLGFYISFSGILTFKNSDALRTVPAALPLNRILIETDSPYLAPTPFRGKTNCPAYLPQTAGVLAELLRLSPDEVAELTSNNAKELFSLSV